MVKKELSNDLVVSNSRFKQKGTGPLYWISYEDCFIHDAPVSQARFLANVDWIAADFLASGYNMVATDGWIEYSTETNENGYLTKYSDSWSYTWKDLVNYCASKGLKFGVYFNPLWVVPSAVYDNSKTVIGTSYKVGDMVDRTYDFSAATGEENHGLSGDRFGYLFNRGEATFYWVDVTKPGAKEYVQGYVNYFKNMGIPYLRVDFLSWYEDGTDHNKVIGKNHTTANYDMALSWIKEACGETMELSIVMPHLKNYGETELKYGDMCRINEDCGKGAWFRFSSFNRGKHYNYWSQYSNPFDGLIYWSEYFGKNKMILDADMLRLNTFANDEERKAAISLFAMAGAPINIADQYDTIGNGAWIYQNPEILALNKSGFVGKPVRSVVSNAADSERWIGMQADGTWIVGFFNRKTIVQIRTINFFNDLGITGEDATIRGLWEHKELGAPGAFYSRSISPRSCFIFKVTPNSVCLKNGGFETRDVSGWDVANKDDMTNFGVDNKNPGTGKYKLNFYKSTNYWQTISQTKKGLVSGTYLVKAKCKQQTGMPKECRMEVSDYGGSEIYINITHGKSYKEYMCTVDVTNGQIKIGFHILGTNCNLQVDDVQLYKMVQ